LGHDCRTITIATISCWLTSFTPNTTDTRFLVPKNLKRNYLNI